MERNKLKEIGIKNRTCYYYGELIKIEDFDFGNILIDRKSCKNILVYNILCKTLFGSKPLFSRFYEVDRFIRVYDGIIYLVSFSPEKYAICNRIRYRISQKKVALHMCFLIIM